MAVRFDASTDAYRATTGLPTGTAYSFTCWAYITTDRDDYSGVAFLDDGGTANGVFLQTDIDGTTLKVFDFAGNSVGSVALTTATWYQTGVSVSGTAVSLYTAPAGGATTTASGTLANAPSAAPTRFGIGDDGFANWWNGRVAAFKMWSAALTQAEVEAEWAAYGAVRTSNLLRVHKFKTAETTDYSGNGNTLTAGSTATTTEGDPPITEKTVRPTIIMGGRSRF